MATDFQIRRLSLGGADVAHSWEFSRGVTVIAGDSGGGKTSLLNLIKYGLGGDVELTETVIEAADSVIVEALLASIHRSHPVPSEE
jgi:DNA repair exonuclease SbcCD ATPase subunit